MRSTISLHFPSLTIGGLGALGLLALAAFRTQSAETALARGPYAWRSLVRVQENYPFVVPDNKVLILSGAGYTWKTDRFDIKPLANPLLTITIDGEIALVLDPISGPSTIEPGWAVSGKSRVSIQYPGEPFVGYAFGYLVDA